MSTTSRTRRFAGLPRLEPTLSVLPPEQARLWPVLGDVPESFVLYGGTGLALRLGHRSSVDFDFFSAEPFAPSDLAAALRWLGRVEIIDAKASTLILTEPGGVRLSFFGGMELAMVAEPALCADNGLVVASLYDLAGTKAKAILDRSEWRDYVDVAAVLRAGLPLADVIGYATAIFARLFPFPVESFARSLVWFGDGTAPDVPAPIRRELESAVRGLDPADIPFVEPWRPSIAL